LFRAALPRCLFRIRKFCNRKMSSASTVDPSSPVQLPVHPPVPSPVRPSPVRTGSPGWAKVRRGWANAAVSSRDSSRSDDSEASDGVRRVSSPIGRLTSPGKGSPSGRNSRSGSTGEAWRPLTQLEVDDEIKALRAQLKAVSLTALEKGFHSGTHKQVDSLQLSRLFGTLGLTVSPEAMKEIGRLTDNADGTLSKQELLEWLETEEGGAGGGAGSGAGGGAGGSAGGSAEGGDGGLPSRALEVLGLQQGGGSSSRAARQRSFQALSLFDSDGDGQARLG